MRIKQSAKNEFFVELTLSDFPTRKALEEASVSIGLPEDYHGTSEDPYLAAVFARHLAEGRTNILFLDSFYVGNARPFGNSSASLFPNIIDGVFARFQESSYNGETAPQFSGMRDSFPEVSEMTLSYATLFILMVTDADKRSNKSLRIKARENVAHRAFCNLPEFPSPQQFLNFLALSTTILNFTQDLKSQDEPLLWELVKKNPVIPFDIFEKKLGRGYRESKPALEALLSMDSLEDMRTMPAELIGSLFPTERPPENWRRPYLD